MMVPGGSRVGTLQVNCLLEASVRIAQRLINTSDTHGTRVDARTSLLDVQSIMH